MYTKEQMRKLKRAYWDQSHAVNKRVDRNGDPIAWNFTFETWLKFWEDSGQLSDRGGAGDQYCMARYNDIGAYSPDNVRIITMSENLSEKGSYFRHSDLTKEKIRIERSKQVFSDETRKKFTERNNKRWAKEKLIPKVLIKCPHCDVSSYGKLIMHRHHLNNCKLLTEKPA